MNKHSEYQQVHEHGDLIPKTRRGRNQHSLAFQIPSASKDFYKYSFFPQTIREWNDLHESLTVS